MNTANTQITDTTAVNTDVTDVTANTANVANNGLTDETIARNEQLALLGEKLGEWKAYDSQLVIPEITGTRIVKALYQKNPKTGEKAQENSYVRIPTKHMTEETIVSRVAELSPFILDWLQEIEALAIREEHKKGALTCFTEYLSLDKIIEALEAKQQSGRLNKEKITAWFNDYVQDELALKFAAKLQITDQSTEADLHKLETVLVAYKTKFETLASPKTFMKEEDCLAMITVINSIEKASSSLLGKQFVAKLQAMSKKQDETLLSL